MATSWCTANAVQGRRSIYIYEPSSFVPLATIQGAGEEHSTYWYQCDQIGAPLDHRRTWPRGLGRTTAYS